MTKSLGLSHVRWCPSSSPRTFCSKAQAQQSAVVKKKHTISKFLKPLPRTFQRIIALREQHAIWFIVLETISLSAHISIFGKVYHSLWSCILCLLSLINANNNLADCMQPFDLNIVCTEEIKNHKRVDQSLRHPWHLSHQRIACSRPLWLGLSKEMKHWYSNWHEICLGSGNHFFHPAFQEWCSQRPRKSKW